MSRFIVLLMLYIASNSNISSHCYNFSRKMVEIANELESVKVISPELFVIFMAVMDVIVCFIVSVVLRMWLHNQIVEAGKYFCLKIRKLSQIYCCCCNKFSAEKLFILIRINLIYERSIMGNTLFWCVLMCWWFYIFCGI